MELLYKNSLIKRNIVFEEIEYKVLVQLRIIVKNELFDFILILQSVDMPEQLMILALDSNTCMVPIANEKAEQIIYAIKKIPFSGSIQEEINKLTYTEFAFAAESNVISLSENTKMYISSTKVSKVVLNISVELKVLDSITLCPELFVYATFDGAAQYIYFEEIIENLLLNRNWGIQSPINLMIDNNEYGEYIVEKSYMSSENLMAFLCTTLIYQIMSKQKRASIKTNKINVYESLDFPSQR